MAERSSEETEALIKRLRTRGDVLYVGLAAILLALGSLAFANGLITLGVLAYGLALFAVIARHQDAQYANQLESDEKKRTAHEHAMKALDALHDRQMEKLDALTKALTAVTEQVLEKLDEERKAIENLPGQEDCAKDEDRQ